MTRNMPKYDILLFYRYCRERAGDVIPLKKALDDANSDFGLKTKKELLAFISNDGLEDLKFEHSKIWENNPNEQNPLFVDSYEFRSMYKLGYIAFIYNDKTDKWIIKSFHILKNHNNAIELAFIKAGLLGDKK